MVRSHRASWEIFNGNIPKGKWVLHRCDIRECVNPNHLFLGNRQDNMDDMVKKGRQSYGEHRHNAKLSNNKAAEIRERYALGGVTQATLAKDFNVSESLIYRVINGQAWRVIDEEDGE